jgi:hypothetical protein
VNLSVQIGKLKLQNPVTFGDSWEYQRTCTEGRCLTRGKSFGKFRSGVSAERRHLVARQQLSAESCCEVLTKSSK